MNNEEFDLKEFFFYAWHYKWNVFWPKKENRCFGPYNLGWYDGDHYGIGLWFFNINFY